MDPLLQYACRRVAELKSLLLVDVCKTVWLAEVGMVYEQIENAGDLPMHHQRHALVKQQKVQRVEVSTIHTYKNWWYHVDIQIMEIDYALK